MTEQGHKQAVREEWPNSIAVREPEGWAVYGGGPGDSELEKMALLATETESEELAWASAAAFVRELSESASDLDADPFDAEMLADCESALRRGNEKAN